MDERLFGTRIGRMATVVLLAILLGSGAGFVAAGVTITVGRSGTAAMEDSSTGGVRPGGFERTQPLCIADSEEDAESTSTSS